MRFVKTRFSLLIFLTLNLSLSAQMLHPLPADHKVEHQAYQLDYNEQTEQANWVFYEVTRAELTGSLERSDNFRRDPKVRSLSAGPNDYRHSGYDRGHLAPAADMRFSSAAMSQCFYMSNMSPQSPGFNRGIWRSLEAQVRAWAYADGELYVVTGPLFIELEGELSGGVDIPSHFFKVLLDWDGEELRTVAFVLPNAKSSRSLSFFEVPIDEVERLSGFDFFSALPDSLETLVEAGTYGFWDYSLRYHAPSSDGSVAQQCKGQTQSGRRCRRRTKDPSGYCWQHR